MKWTCTQSPQMWIISGEMSPASLPPSYSDGQNCAGRLSPAYLQVNIWSVNQWLAGLTQRSCTASVWCSVNRCYFLRTSTSNQGSRLSSHRQPASVDLQDWSPHRETRKRWQTWNQNLTALMFAIDFNDVLILALLPPSGQKYPDALNWQNYPQNCKSWCVLL